MATELTEWRPMTELRHRIDQIFRDIGDGDGIARGWTPSVDVVRSDESIVLRVDLPGIKPDEVKISVQDGVLTVSGEHEEKSEEKKERFVRRERRYGSFSRSMALPRGVKADDIEATTEDGVLEVTIPLPAEEKEQQVEIKPTPKGD
ncbi:MAG: Hsp20/alpha crystallin family protein [Solirubrobacterales bacterium]